MSVFHIAYVKNTTVHKPKKKPAKNTLFTKMKVILEKKTGNS